MKTFQGSFGTVVAVNVKLLFSFLFAVTAFLFWPSGPDWWGFGLVSILLGGAALSLFAEAVKAALKLYTRDKVIAEYLAQGRMPKSSVLASKDDLDKAGMR